MVTISNDLALELLENRLRECVEFRWVTEKEIPLYLAMYESYIDGGCFDGAVFDVWSIVDNDLVNWTEILHRDDLDNVSKADYETMLQKYRDGERDISCDGLGYSFVEAASDDGSMILVRH